MPTTDCIAQTTFKFQGQGRRIEVDADAPTLSSDGGVLALRRIDEALGLTKALAAAVGDKRNPLLVVHSRAEQLRQRIYQIALGYEDCNDADVMRHDPLLQVVCTDSGGPYALSSQPTLSRLENAVGGERVRRLWQVLEDQYVQALAPDAPLVVLDIDSTDDPTHGEQQLAFFHGFYDQHMFHPLLVFDGESGQLISAILRPGRAHAAWSAEGLLRRLIRAIRARCPHADIVVRGDSAFAMPWLHVASDAHVRRFVWLDYAAKTWTQPRKVVLKAEHGTRGENPRFVVTNVDWVDGRSVYDGAYCPRGQAENFIKDFKNALRADRLSCHRFVANAFRLLLHAAAYRLMHALRAKVAVVDPKLGRAQMDTLRLRLLKVAAIVTVSVRRVLVRLPRAFPLVSILLSLLDPPPTD